MSRRIEVRKEGREGEGSEGYHYDGENSVIN